jgi:hypothetical protein
MAYEQPEYTVVERYDDFELRRYDPYIVAETDIHGNFSEVGNEAFGILSGYIFGNNRQQTRMEMTAPVNQVPASRSGETIDMTAPVSQKMLSDADSTYTLSFVMPSAWTLATLPEPVDERIRLRKIDSRLVAARTYSGTWSESRYRTNEEKLLQAIRAANLETTGEPVFARYNSPFTLWFLRRNEVQVEIAP